MKKGIFDFFGGLFDFNRNGRTDPWELWIWHQIMQDVLKDDSENNEEDSFGITDDDLDCLPLEEFENDSLLFETEIDEHDDLGDPNFSPNDSETEDYYETESDVDEEGETNSDSSANCTLRESDFPNKRTYWAAYKLASCNDDESDTKRKCYFVLNNPDLIAAKYYSILDNRFLFSQALKENMDIPVILPDEDEWVKTLFFDLIKSIAERDINLSLKAWRWCVDSFLPYAEYADNYDREQLTYSIINEVWLMPDGFTNALVHYLQSNPEFSKKILRDAPKISSCVSELLCDAAENDEIDAASIILSDVLDNNAVEYQTVCSIIDVLAFSCKTWRDTNRAQFFLNYILPLLQKTKKEEYIEYAKLVSADIESHCRTVERILAEKEDREKRKKQMPVFLKSLEEIASRVEKGDVWEGFGVNTPECVTYDFIYPNGKIGDIEMFISSTYGEIIKKDGLNYSAKISTNHKEQILLLKYSYSNSLYNDVPRDDVDSFLYQYNLGHKLRQLCDDYIVLSHRIGSSIKDTEEEILQYKQNDIIRGKALAVANEYIAEVRQERHKLYGEIVKAGLASSKWSSEQKAYLIVKNVYPDALFQYHSDWLELQSLDIYIPSKRIAIEYQGKQHYEEVSFFGGKEGLERNRRRDSIKRTKCAENGIRLIEWRYDEPLTEAYIRNKIELAEKVSL